MEAKTRKIEWQTSKGDNCSITIELQLTKTVYADGDDITVKCCEMVTNAMHGDKEMGGYVDASDYARKRIAAAGAGETHAAICGRLLVPNEAYAQYVAAKAELESTPEWQAKVEREAKAIAEEIEDEKHYNRITNMMTLNGTTY